VYVHKGSAARTGSFSDLETAVKNGELIKAIWSNM